MNLHENLMAKCSANGKWNQRKKMIVVTIQRGGSINGDKGRKKCLFDTSSNSTDLLWQDSQKFTTTDFSTLETSRTMNGSDIESKVIVALTQGRGDAACEVGLAAMNIKRPALTLCQISDSQSFINVLTKINVFNPIEIIIPITMASTRLCEKIKEQFKDVRITGVQRNLFNNTNGLQYVKKLCASAWSSIILNLQYKYYALTAASALLSYVENHLYVFFARNSIKVDYQESEGYTIIDVFTADKLELTACALDDVNPRYSSLLGVLNNCVTKIGAITLRAAILQPPCSIPDIENRLDCVEELTTSDDKISKIQELLKPISKIDQLMTLAMIMPDDSQNCSERQLNYILLLNSLFDILEPLGDIFVDMNHPFFLELKATLHCEEFARLKTLIRSIIHENARPAVGEKGSMQRCFAIKTGINPILDIIRKKYSERLDQMREYVRTLGSKYGLDFKLENNSKKGFHILLKLNKNQFKSFKLSSLPIEFIRVERLTTMVTMTTTDILTFSARLDEIMVEILKISNIIIYNLLVEIKKSIGLLYKLCEEIAKLDMYQSLAEASSAVHNCVRPKFGNFTEVIAGRHPMLQYLCSNEPIANDIFALPQYNVNIITGPNGSGKSIYIRQIVLLQIMAQIGCFVPATSATFRVADRILARIYLEDDMNCGASAFVLEMKEIKYFLTVLTKNTLVVIDELCRSTSVIEGTALAMAICERFLMTPAFVFFTTHYTFITKLQEMYYNLKCWQLEAMEVTIAEATRLKFTYKVLPGVTTLEKYAIHLARLSWHKNVIKDVEDILKYLKIKEMNSDVTKVDPRLRLKYDLESELQILNYKDQLNCAAVTQLLYKYQANLQQLNVYIDWNNEDGSGRSFAQPSENSFNAAFIPEVVYSGNSNTLQNEGTKFIKLENVSPPQEAHDITLNQSGRFVHTASLAEASGKRQVQLEESSFINSCGVDEMISILEGNSNEGENVNSFHSQNSNDALDSLRSENPSSFKIEDLRNFNDYEDYDMSILHHSQLHSTSCKDDNVQEISFNCDINSHLQISNFENMSFGKNSNFMQDELHAQSQECQDNNFFNFISNSTNIFTEENTKGINNQYLPSTDKNENYVSCSVNSQQSAEIFDNSIIQQNNPDSPSEYLQCGQADISRHQPSNSIDKPIMLQGKRKPFEMSASSINELQFSLPLQCNAEKTSTPIIRRKCGTQPISNFKSPTPKRRKIAKDEIILHKSVTADNSPRQFLKDKFIILDHTILKRKEIKRNEDEITNSPKRTKQLMQEICNDAEQSATSSVSSQSPAKIITEYAIVHHNGDSSNEADVKMKIDNKLLSTQQILTDMKNLQLSNSREITNDKLPLNGHKFITYSANDSPMQPKVAQNAKEISVNSIISTHNLSTSEVNEVVDDLRNFSTCFDDDWKEDSNIQRKEDKSSVSDEIFNADTIIIEAESDVESISYSPDCNILEQHTRQLHNSEENLVLEKCCNNEEDNDKLLEEYIAESNEANKTVAKNNEILQQCSRKSRPNKTDSISSVSASFYSCNSEQNDKLLQEDSDILEQYVAKSSEECLQKSCNFEDSTSLKITDNLQKSTPNLKELAPNLKKITPNLQKITPNETTLPNHNLIKPSSSNTDALEKSQKLPQENDIPYQCVDNPNEYSKPNSDKPKCLITPTKPTLSNSTSFNSAKAVTGASSKSENVSSKSDENHQSANNEISGNGSTDYQDYLNSSDYRSEESMLCAISSTQQVGQLIFKKINAEPKDKASIFEDTLTDTSFNLSTDNGTFKTPIKKASKPINKMTLKEIKESFHERDMKHIDCKGDSCAKYSEEILNRPNPKQIKAAKEIAHVRKTQDGGVVITQNKNTERAKRPKFKPPLKHRPKEQFDVTIFSDEKSVEYKRFFEATDSSRNEMNVRQNNDKLENLLLKYL